MKLKRFKRFLKFFGSLTGGGAKKQQVKPLPPVSDTARSVSLGSVIEILCSGGNYGIQGLLTPNNVKESIFLEETPLSRDGIDFYKVIQIEPRYGINFQGHLYGFGNQAVSENAVGAEVQFGNPLTRSFINDAVTAVKIRVGVILNQNKISDGQVVQITGAAISFDVYIKEGAGAFHHRGVIWISGKFTDVFEKVYTFPINLSRTESTFFIRIVRTSPPDTIDEKRVLYWQSYSEVIEELHRFKRMALVGIQFDAEQFGSSFPERRYHIGGQYLEIPTNAAITEDRGLSYTGNWNGLLHVPYTRACADAFAIIWYLLTDEIDGLGVDLKPSMIDRYSLYEISKYNNELVPDGRGGLERRFLFNLVINKEQEGFKVIDSILSGCNARRYTEGGLIKFTQDRQEPIFCIVTNADIEGYFTYSSTDIDERANAVNVTWVDLENFGKTRTKYVNDPALIAKNGYLVKDVEAVGCTRESQAARFGAAIIYSENYETTNVTFKGRQYLGNIPIGKVIAIADYFESGARLGGIITSHTSNTITLDFPVTIKQAVGFDDVFYLTFYPDVREAVRIGYFKNAYDHYLQHGIAEGRWTNGYLVIIQTSTGVIRRRVQNLPGNYLTVTLTDSIPALLPNTNWLMFTPEYKHKLFRVVSKEPDDENIDSINMTCTQYNDYKWEKIERKIELDVYKPTTKPPTVKAPISFIATHYVLQNQIITIDVSWFDKDITNTSYYIGYNYSGTWFETQVKTNYFTITNALPGEYSFRVASVGYTGIISQYTLLTNVLVSEAQTVADFSNSAYSPVFF